MMAGKCFVFRFDDVEVHEREFLLTKAGKPLTVEPKAFRALLFLLRNPQKVTSKEELLNSVWGDTAVTDGSLTRCIWLLRHVLEDDIHSPRYIETVATVGYRFIAKVEVTEDAPGEPKEPEEQNSLRGVVTKAGSRKQLWVWALVGGGVPALCLAATIWYLFRPMPPLRVTGYTQITHDNFLKNLEGTDGNRLYFNASPGLATAGPIFQVAVSGGLAGQIPVPLPSPMLEDVSPDGANLLVRSVPEGRSRQYPLWNVRILGGSMRRLGDALCASFSPDGNSVALCKDGIWLVQSDGTGAHKLAAVGGVLWDLAWSPDGSVIRFTREEKIGTENQLWEMSSTGSNPHQLLAGWHGPAWRCCGRWTRDGKFFLFNVGYEIWALDERRRLFRRPPDTPIQLAGGPISWHNPIPSKDGSKIFAEGDIYRGELSRFDSKTRQFQPFLGGISAQMLVFSKDGKSVSYVSHPDGILWKADRDGSHPVQLIDPPMEAGLP